MISRLFKFIDPNVSLKMYCPELEGSIMASRRQVLPLVPYTKKRKKVEKNTELESIASNAIHPEGV